MRCSQCQHDNPADQKFCGECGARLSLSCPVCRTSNPPTNKFCGECGTALAPAQGPAATALPGAANPAPAPARWVADRFASPEAYTPRHLAEKILTSRTALEGERKQVTVMFTDVSGFTAMSERLDPEEVHAIMERTSDVILRAVHGLEGTITQFLGDGVMALFGAPIAHEDHTGRALRAALAIQDGLEPLRADVARAHARDFRMRIGINTGPVVVGAIGRDLRMEYTAIGDTVNLAARLLNIAQPGQIVLSRRTKEPCEGFFVFDDLGDFRVKGKTEPVRAFAVKAEIRGRSRLEVSRARGLTGLVGRDQELDRLRAAFAGAAAGQGSGVLVLGEPGVGKSRLLYEFVHGLDGIDRLELESTCVPFGGSMPYRPVLDFLRHYLDLPVAFPERDIRLRASERLRALGLDAEESAVLLAHFLGAPAPPELLARLSGAELKDRTVDLVKEMLLRASEDVPIVVIVENVHWADASSGELLAHLARHLAGHRVLLVLSARPPSALPWLPLQTFETIDLGGLEHAETERMARSALGAERVSGSLRELLVDKGQGNPLYIEELLHQLQETGGLVVEGGEVRLRSADVTVPAAIHDIIAARVDRLAEPAKLALQAAAVAGRRFGDRLISRVLGLPPEQVAASLHDLHRLDFVFPATTDPDLMYSFKHALSQDVVYGSLLERRRRQYHAAIGVALEELYVERPDEVVELMAYHFAHGGEDEKAFDYEIRAAEKAQRHWAYTEALSHFDSGLKRLTAMPDTELNRLRRIDGVIKQAEIMFALGRHAGHIEALESIKDLVSSTPDPVRRASWYYWAGFLHSLTGARPDIPIAYCLEASAIARTTGLEELRASADCCLSQVYAYAGRLHEAMAAGERALPVFEGRGNVWWACRTLWSLSLAAIPLGLWESSLQYCRRALSHGQDVGDRRLQVVGWWRTGWTHTQRGEPAVGVGCCEQALALAPGPYDAAMTRAVLGYSFVKMGKLDGIPMLVEAVDWFEKSRLPFTRTWYSLWLADAYVHVDDLSNAREVAEEVLPRTRERGYRYFEGMAERLLGTALVGLEPAAAVPHLKAAQIILEEVGAMNEVAKTLVATGRLLSASGDREQARALLQQGLSIFEQLGTLDEPPRVRALLEGLPPAG